VQAPARHSLPRVRRLSTWLVLGVAALVLGGCADTVGFDDGGGDKTLGKELFVSGCGSCHVLADAQTTGEIGPNLDYAFFQYRVDTSGADPEDADFQEQLAKPGVESGVRQVVRGQIAYPVVTPASGAPGMPADIVTGSDADAVAAYVASVAGLGGDGGPPEPPSTGGGDGGGGNGGAPDGESIFASAGCGGCHTLAAAGASGSVGPNLDEPQPTLELALDRITNGQGGMPSFGGQLSEQEIEAVAQYVVDNAGS
jgi:mono/diheme cytochrome c family protein